MENIPNTLTFGDYTFKLNTNNSNVYCQFEDEIITSIDIGCNFNESNFYNNIMAPTIYISTDGNFGTSLKSLEKNNLKIQSFMLSAKKADNSCIYFKPYINNINVVICDFFEKSAHIKINCSVFVNQIDGVNEEMPCCLDVELPFRFYKKAKVMSIDDIKNKLKKKAIGFETGGIRPTNELGESWIGKVCWQSPEDTWPIGEDGEKMIPLATLFLDNLEYIPNSLKNIKMINIFVDICFLDNLDADSYNEWFKIYTYESLDNLIRCEYTSEEIKPFPLVPKLIDNDFPNHDYLDSNMSDIIYKKEKNGDINYYDDIFEDNFQSHKIGGYPSNIQDGLEFNDGYEFVLQITSDSKAEFDIVDCGNFYFGYNPKTKDWDIKCDFY